MFADLEIMRMAHGLASHAAERQAVIARNIANADTPGYRAMDVPTFREIYDSAPPAALRRTRPGHIAPGPAQDAALRARPDPSAEAAPNGNTVSIEAEMVRSVETQRAHDLGLTIYATAMNILRTGMGRGR